MLCPFTIQTHLVRHLRNESSGRRTTNNLFLTSHISHIEKIVLEFPAQMAGPGYGQKLGYSKNEKMCINRI